MQTKDCPDCGATVPAAAKRCKECFHDFEAAPPKSGGPMALLVAFALMAIIGGGVFWYLSQQPSDTRILVDAETRTVQWVTQYQGDRLATDRISFDDIVKLEYVVTSAGTFEIAALTKDGERKIVESHNDRPLQLKAEKYADVMGKELTVIDNTFGFNK